MFSNFIDERDHRKTLLMVVYSGHAHEREYEYLLKGTRHPGMITDWLYVSRDLIRMNHADVLVVMDCCYA